MSEAIRCFMCGGLGYVIIEYDPDGHDRTEECTRCKGSGGLNLRPVGPGFPKLDDIYIPVPKGVNW